MGCSCAKGSRESEVQVVSGFGAPIGFISKCSPEKIISAHSLRDQFLYHVPTQQEPDTVGGMRGIVSLLQLKNSIPIAKPKLRRRNFTVEFQHPEIQSPLGQQPAAQFEIKSPPLGRPKTAALSGGLPPRLVMHE